MSTAAKKGYVWTLPTMETHGRAPTEHEEQVDFVRWFRQTYTIPLGVRIFAIPNGSAVTSKAQGAKLMSEGVSPGIPDLCVPAWGPLWIEMKRPKKSHTSELQKLWHEYLRSLPGHTVIKPKGSAEAQAMVREFLAGRAA
jgi:hypothetical protein